MSSLGSSLGLDAGDLFSGDPFGKLFSAFTDDETGEVKCEEDVKPPIACTSETKASSPTPKIASAPASPEARPIDPETEGLLDEPIGALEVFILAVNTPCDGGLAPLENVEVRLLLSDGMHAGEVLWSGAREGIETPVPALAVHDISADLQFSVFVSRPVAALTVSDVLEMPALAARAAGADTMERMLGGISSAGLAILPLTELIRAESISSLVRKTEFHQRLQLELVPPASAPLGLGAQRRLVAAENGVGVTRPSSALGHLVVDLRLVLTQPPAYMYLRRPPPPPHLILYEDAQSAPGNNGPTTRRRSPLASPVPAVGKVHMSPVQSMSSYASACASAALAYASPECSAAVEELASLDEARQKLGDGIRRINQAIRVPAEFFQDIQWFLWRNKVLAILVLITWAFATMRVPIWLWPLCLWLIIVVTSLVAAQRSRPTVAFWHEEAQGQALTLAEKTRRALGRMSHVERFCDHTASGLERLRLALSCEDRLCSVVLLGFALCVVFVASLFISLIRFMTLPARLVSFCSGLMLLLPLDVHRKAWLKRLPATVNQGNSQALATAIVGPFNRVPDMAEANHRRLCARFATRISDEDDQESESLSTGVPQEPGIDVVPEEEPGEDEEEPGEDEETTDGAPHWSDGWYQ